MWLVGVVSRRRVWLVGVGGICGGGYILGVVVRRYIDFLILLIPTPLVYICSFLQQQHPYFLFIFKVFFVLVPVLFCNNILCMK